MIAYIYGKVVQKFEDYIILEHNGMGLQIYASRPYEFEIDTNQLIHTYQHVREDAILLFGFSSLDQKNVFLELINVKGIGPKTALNILSKTTPEAFIRALENQDIDYLKTLPGIGKKTASQIVLDLKGKLFSDQMNIGNDNSLFEETMSALEELGFTRKEIRSIQNEIVKYEKNGIDIMIKEGLKLLARKGGH